MNLRITCLPRNIFETELKEMFEKYGKVISAKVLIDPISLKSRGIGFVLMAYDKDAQLAIKSLHGLEKDDKTLSIRIMEEKKPLNPVGNFRPGNNRGGFDSTRINRERKRY